MGLVLYVLSTAGEKLTIANHHSFYIVCVSKRLRILKFYSINNITLVCFFKRWFRKNCVFSAQSAVHKTISANSAQYQMS